MGDFLPDGLSTFKVVNEVLELTGFNRFELLIAEVFNKLSSITLKKLLLAPRGFLIRRLRDHLYSNFWQTPNGELFLGLSELKHWLFYLPMLSTALLPGATMLIPQDRYLN